MAADLLTMIRAEIEFRLRDLEPAVHEYEELMSLRDALAGLDSPPARSRAEGDPFPPATAEAAPSGPARSARPRPSAGLATTARAPVTRRPSGPRAERRRPDRIDGGGQAILAALDHGSHTIAELVIVTAMPAPKLRTSLRRLLAHALIVKTDRSGKTAYALAARD
jgi:hypothetical protein